MENPFVYGKVARGESFADRAGVEQFVETTTAR